MPRAAHVLLLMLFSLAAIAAPPSTVEHTLPASPIPTLRTVQAPADSTFIAAYEGRHDELVVLEAASGRGKGLVTHYVLLAFAGAELPRHTMRLIGVVELAPNKPMVLVYYVTALADD